MHFKRGMPELLNRNGGSQLQLNKYTEIYKYMAQTKARHRQRQGTTAGVFQKNCTIKRNTLHEEGSQVLLNIVTEIHKRMAKGKAQAKTRQGGRSISKKFHSKRKNITKKGEASIIKYSHRNT
jgi:hypothetical protein